MAASAGAGDTPAKLFRGYDSVARGMLSSTGVTGGLEQTGGRSVVNIRVCESEEELAQALEIDASLSVSYLKAVNVTAKMNFMKKLNVTARSVTIVVYASHETGTWAANNIALKQGVQPPANSGDAAADFVQAYGDSFVSSATQGGEYYAVYTFHTETQTEQQTLAAELKGKVGHGGVKVEADVQTKLSDFLKQTSISWTLNQEMTGIASPTFPSENNLIEFARKFPTVTLTSPVTTGFSVMGYESVPGFSNFAKVKTNRRYFLGEQGVLKSLGRLKGLQNQIAWLKRIYARYEYSGDTELLAFERQVKADIAKVNDQIDEWDDNATATFRKPELTSLDKGEPVLTYVVGQSPEYGYIGGDPFGIVSVGDALRNQVRLKTVTLGVRDNNLARLRLEYASERKESLIEERGHGGVNTHSLAIEEGQFPVKFDIYWDRQVQRLQVHLSDGRSLAGGNSQNAKHATWSVPEGYVVLGLAGKAASVIDEIKFVHAKLQPAEYKMPV